LKPESRLQRITLWNAEDKIETDEKESISDMADW
jgi:hypothetical protein